MSEHDEASERELSKLGETQRKASSAGPMRNMIPGEKARDVKGTVGKLIRFIGRFKGLLVLALLFAVGSTVFSIVGPKALSTATTELFEGVMGKIAGAGGIDFDAIARILLFTLGLYVLSAVCSFVQGWMLTSVSQRTCFELRREIAAKVDRLPVGYFERTSVGDTLSRVTNDVDTLGQSLNQGISELVRSAITIVGILIMMFSINWVMTLVTLVIVPVSFALIRVIVKRSQKYFYAQQETLGALDGQVEETFSGHAVVKAFGREDETVATFNETNGRLYESAWKSQFLSGLMRPALDFVGNLGLSLIHI